MQARNIKAGRHSVAGSNVTQVRTWALLTEVVLADGRRISYFPTESVKVMPTRDANGKFLPREYLLMMVIDGRDVVISYTGRSLARKYRALFAYSYGVSVSMVAI